MTLRQVVDEFGALPAFRDAVKAMRDHADMKLKEANAAKKRGEHVDRSVISAVVMPLVELAYKRLVAEAPAITHYGRPPVCVRPKI